LRSDLLTKIAAAIRGGGDPRYNMAAVAEPKKGPPSRNLAADAHGCIMVRATMVDRIQVCGAQVRATGGFRL
jgi:hypothetical protein